MPKNWGVLCPENMVLQDLSHQVWCQWHEVLLVHACLVIEISTSAVRVDIYIYTSRPTHDIWELRMLFVCGLLSLFGEMQQTKCCFHDKWNNNTKHQELYHCTNVQEKWTYGEFLKQNQCLITALSLFIVLVKILLFLLFLLFFLKYIKW